ncbi:MAG: hypothetical protein EOO03_00970, partial [Chitinophagaceae bacterium]
MKKYVCLCLSTLLVLGLSAQNPALKIPATANIVGSIDLGKINNLMPIADWEKTSLGKKLAGTNKQDSSMPAKSLQDAGFNPNSTVYYFHTENDSMHINTVLVQLADAGKTDHFFADKELVRLAGNVRKFADADSTGYCMWNNDQLLYVNAIIKNDYFKNATIAARHGLSNAVVTTKIWDEEVTDEEDTMDSATVEIATDTAELGKKEIIDEEVEIIEELDTASIVYEQADEYEFDYYNDQKIKKALMNAAASAAIQDYFYNTPATSILSNSGYIKNFDATAAAAIWVDKPMNFYRSLIPGYLTYKTNPLAMTYPMQDDAGYKSFAAHLQVNSKRLTMHTQMEMTPEMAAMQQSILDRKLNKRFFKYINSDSLLGYMSWALDTKAYLDNMPRIMERTYGDLGGGVGRDEIALGTEFLSFLLDEEAIADMVKGDAMVVFDGVYQQTTKYTDYSYDENFKPTAVEKERTETLPKFLLMLSSEENDLTRKLLRYGMNKSVIKQKPGYYELEIPKSPMRIFFTHKDDIFFLSNAEKNLQSITTGNFEANIAKAEKKLLRDHPFAMYMNPKKIGGKLAATDWGAAESLSGMINTFPFFLRG